MISYNWFIQIDIGINYMDNKKTKIDLALNVELLEKIREIAQTRFNAPIHHISKKPEITPTIIKLIELGIKSIEDEDEIVFQDEKPISLRGKCEALERKFDSLVEDFNRLREQVLDVYPHSYQDTDKDKDIDEETIEIEVEIENHQDKDRESIGIDPNTDSYQDKDKDKMGIEDNQDKDRETIGIESNTANYEDKNEDNEESIEVEDLTSQKKGNHKGLTDEQKTEIVDLYRDTEHTASTLAEKFNVAVTTISRSLKGSLIKTEYERLKQKKRLQRPNSKRKP